MTAKGRPIDLWDRGGLDLGSWGELKVVDFRHLGIVQNGRTREIEVGDLFEVDTALVGWFVEDTGLAVLATSTGPSVARLDLTLDEYTRLTTLARDRAHDMAFMRVVPANEYLIAYYELGLVCLDSACWIKWQAEYNDPVPEYLGAHDGQVWFGTQLPGGEDYRRSYRLLDGKQLTG